MLRQMIRYVQDGYLSDPPGMSMYVETHKLAGGFQMHRSLRNSSALEGYHAHLRLFGNLMGNRVSVKVQLLRSLAFDFRWNVFQAEKYGLLSGDGERVQHGHTKLEL